MAMPVPAQPTEWTVEMVYALSDDGNWYEVIGGRAGPLRSSISGTPQQRGTFVSTCVSTFFCRVGHIDATGSVAERVRFELTCRNYPTIRFRVGAVMTTSVPLRRNNLTGREALAGRLEGDGQPRLRGWYSSGSSSSKGRFAKDA